VQKETTKSHPRRHDNTYGKKEVEKKLKGDKKHLTSKQKENVNSMGSLVFHIQHKGICCYNDMKDNFKITFGYLAIHLSIIHPLSNKMIMVAIGNMYLTTTTFFLKGVHIVLRFFQSVFHLFWCKHRCMYPKIEKIPLRITTSPPSLNTSLATCF
jgi:hypothetical protein